MKLIILLLLVTSLYSQEKTLIVDYSYDIYSYDIYNYNTDPEDIESYIDDSIELH